MGELLGAGDAGPLPPARLRAACVSNNDATTHRVNSDPHRSDPHRIDDFFRRAAAAILADPVWRAEFESSRAEFFPAEHAPADVPAAARRHLEWFLLERVDPHGPELAFERIVRELEPDADHAAEWSARLRETHVGVLEVTGVQPGEGLWVRDLGGRGEFPVSEEAASHVVQVGDILAGRLFPIGGGTFQLSTGAAFHRDARLLEALRADFDRARENNRGVLRVGQRQVESIFFGRARSAPTDAVADARKLLVGSGIEPELVETFFEDLAQAPWDEDRLVHGAQDVLSEILDDLAFESAVDIDAARRALLAAWAQLANRGPGTGPTIDRPTPETAGVADPATDVATAVARFEERRQAGEPVAKLLDELERDLALEEPGGESDTDGDPIPDFPGVVGAMVEEFLWEASTREGDAAAVRHANLRDLGRATEHVGVFENLGPRDLLVYAGWWLPETGTLAGADDARARIASLAAFCHWAEREHELKLHSEFQPTLARLGDSLPRIAEANERRTRGARRDEGELFELLKLEDERVQLRSKSDRVLAARIEPDLASWLRPGDRVRGSVRDQERLAVYCCYPPEVAALTQAADDSAEG